MKLPKGIRIRNGSYIAYATMPNGKPVRKAVGRVGCITPKQAAQERSDLEKEIRDGKYVPAGSLPKPAPESAVVTCTDLWDTYLADCTNREKRVDRLKTAWTHLKLSFGDKPATEVMPRDIVAYVTARRAVGRTGGCINRELAVLKAAFRYGARSEMITRIPMFPKRLKESRPRQGFVEEPQYELLASNCKDMWLRCFVALGFNFGFRKSEMLGLCVRNVDLLGGWLVIETSKNGEGRKVALTRETSSLLLECVRGKQPDDFVLTRHDGSRVAQPRKDWYNLCVRCGLGKWIEKQSADGETSSKHYQGLQMHDLRRSAVRRLVRSGISEKICMAISGHKSRSVFDRYNLTNERDLEQAAKLLEPSRQVSVSEAKTDTKTDTLRFAHS